MTSLELQLKRLQREPTAQELSVTRDHSSLLFDEKEAANYTREQYYDIGITGLSHLCKFDADFDKYEPELFDRTKIDQNRALLQKTENDELNKSLQRMIIRLSPYFHYFACKQVLEWLIHKFKIHKYNAEFLAVALLPHHASNSYGRLLKILHFHDPMWNFTEQYARDATPIPLNVLIRVCHAKNLVGSSLITAFSHYLVGAVKLVGEDYVGQKLHTSCTFFAAFMMNLFENPAKVNDQLIARAIPDVAIALSSKIPPLKFAGLMIASRIVLSAQLSEEFVSNILKLTLLKMKNSWLDAALDTALLICQKQNVTSLPRKATLKLLKNQEDFNFVAALKKRMDLYDTSNFLSALWKTLFDVLAEKVEKEEKQELAERMIEILELDKLSDEDARRFFNVLLIALTGTNGSSTQMMPKNLRKHVHAMVIRFATIFDAIRAEWMVRDKEVLDLLMSVCQIQEHEVGEMSIKRVRRRRTSSCGSRRSFSQYEDSAFVSEIPEDTDNTITEEEKIKNAQAQVIQQRPPFRKSILKILEMVQEKCDTETVEWALDSFNDPTYMKKQLNSDLEQFFLRMLLHVSRDPKFPAKVKLKGAMSQIKIGADIVGLLLSDLTSFEPTPKRTKLAIKSVDEQVASIFVGESCSECQRRIVFALEVFITSNGINFKTLANEKIMHCLFEMIDKEQGKIKLSSTSAADKDASAYVQQLGLVLAKKIIGQHSSNCVNNYVLSTLVNVIRFAHTTVVLRSALGVLARVAAVMPKETVLQFMTLFAFMGDGVVRRDDETTLQIFEETLQTLFYAILGYDCSNFKDGYDFQITIKSCAHKINEIMRIFTKSLSDIPPHRCVRLLRTALSIVPANTVWIVLSILFEDYCVRWQEAKTTKKTIDQHFDDLLLELMGELPIDKQVQIMKDFSEYLNGIGKEKEEKNDQSLSSDQSVLSGHVTGNKVVSSVNKYLVVFDTTAHSDNTVRHFRFITFRFMNKCLQNIAVLKKKAK